MDPEDLKLLNENLGLVRKILGSKEKKIVEVELPARKNARRSLVTSKSIIKGSMITEENITTKRPGKGIDPIYYDLLLGKKVLKDLDEDEILYWKYLLEE